MKKETKSVGRAPKSGVGSRATRADRSDPIAAQELATMAARSEKAATHALFWFEQTAAADPRNAGPKLVLMARSFCEAVASWVEKCPKEAEDLARKLPDWPAVHGRHFAIKKDTGVMLEKL